ncbi:alpha-2C adrenergic receptor-like [Lingula anatina]|uniref:Alpha-2C adrenergic receptor-like n=1 Tax=Lingula anatina TaxID=7574 RepID=A0A2R2MP42_LINAN|nr:alpha-2C adrenergic receptor-like [Lingula anatina]|eukprot:XP_023931792.1 alpha-2C adrenergic receptor-like [Lingula anatina]
MFHTQSLQTTSKTMTTIRALLTFKMSDITTLQSPHNVSTTVNQKESGLNSTCALPSCYSTLHIALASVVVVAIMIGIIFGNIMVILAILTDNQLRSIQNSFLVSLAVADLLVGLLIMPLCLSYELMGYWYFGEVLCELWLAMDVLLTTASILNLCIISLDRYWSITRAVEYVKKRTPFRAGIMIATAWIISAIICLPPLIGWKKPQKPHRCELTDDIGYVLYSTTGSFFIPLIIILVVYGNIFRAAKSRARRHVKNLRRKPAENNGVSMNSMPRAETKRSIGSYYEEIDSESGEHSPHALEKNESEMDTSHPKLGYSSQADQRLLVAVVMGLESHPTNV